MKNKNINININIYSNLCKLVWFFMLIVVILSVIHGAMLYKYFEIYPQKEYTIGRYNPELPEEAIIKIKLMNTLRLILGMGVLLIVVYFYCEYKASPEDHWINSFKKIKLEED